MKLSCLPLALIVLLLLTGCTPVSLVEKANLTDKVTRENFIENHPDCPFKDYIREGEIVRGMDIYEVIASWGLPNVYVTSKETDYEYWVYYVACENSNSILIYTLKFNGDMLEDWDIDQKRFVDQRIITEAVPIREKPIQIAPRGKR